MWMGVGDKHWPAEVTEEDMHDAVGEDEFEVKPFSTKSGLGMGVKIVCSCGCQSIGVYHMVEKESISVVGVLTDYINDGTAPIRTKRGWVRMWTLMDVQMTYTPSANTHAQLAHKMAAMIPGITDKVLNPCNCKKFDRTIWGMIQHLNDAHHPANGDEEDDDPWSRERIADWLETLDADLVVDPERNVPITRVAKFETDGAFVKATANALVSFQEAMLELDDALDKFKTNLMFLKEPTKLKAKDMHALSMAYLHSGEAGMATIMAEKGISTMQVEEAFMQPSSTTKHDPCSCFICKIQKKKTNQEES